MSAPTKIDPAELRRMDMQTHSTFSDGRDSIADNVAAAEEAGLVRLTCTDHVRRDTDYLPDYVAEIRRVREGTDVEITCGIEAKILDTSGELDMPAELPDGIEALYAADHQVPTPQGPAKPDEIKERIESGELTSGEVLEWIVAATAATVGRYDDVVICHLFSVLPKLGIEEDEVPLDLIEGLAEAAADRGAKIEIDERWSCPSARTIRPFVERGVPLLLSTDSHRSDTIGKYEYALEVLRELNEN
jgi:putative hydrolase